MIYSSGAHIDGSLHALPHPVHQLRLSELRQVVDALLAEGINAAEVHVLRWRLADTLDNDGRVRLKDNAVIDDLVYSERNQIVVLQEGSLIDLGAEEEVERVSQSKDDAVEKYLRHVLDSDTPKHCMSIAKQTSFSWPTTYIITSDSCRRPLVLASCPSRRIAASRPGEAYHLEKDKPAIVKDDVCGLLRCLLEETSLEIPLRLHVRVRLVGARSGFALAGSGCGAVGLVVILGKNTIICDRGLAVGIGFEPYCRRYLCRLRGQVSKPPGRRKERVPQPSWICKSSK